LILEDTGIGVPPEAIGGLFDPFTQADISTTRRYGGTGLGLTIVKQLVDLMHGAVRCESEAGRGSRFTVTLPLHPCQVGTETTVKKDSLDLGEGIVPIGQGRKLLLAEDHPVNREVITRQLARLGFECECVEDGQQAWERLTSTDGRYSMLLTDCRMPRLDGYELAVRMREFEARFELQRLPIIALTANALEGEAEHCIALGMDGYLPKPVQIRDLHDALLKALPPDRPLEATTPTDAYPTLARLCRGDHRDVAELLRVFITATSKDLEAFDRAVETGGLEVLRHLAHRLSSVCRQLDETRAVASLLAIERLEQLEKAIVTAARSDVASALARAARFSGSNPWPVTQEFSPCSRE
jgi:CheY-like chemotaxis protein